MFVHTLQAWVWKHYFSEFSTVLISKQKEKKITQYYHFLSVLQDLLEISSNLFDAPRRRRWISIQQNNGGASKLMGELEDYAINMAERMQSGTNGSMGDLDTVISSDNIGKDGNVWVKRNLSRITQPF